MFLSTSKALLTDYRNCDAIKKATQSISYCEANEKEIERLKADKQLIPITEDACGQAGLRWVKKRQNDFFCGRPSHGSRDNHHGQNGPTGHSFFDWTVPSDVPTNHPCVVRIR